MPRGIEGGLVSWRLLAPLLLVVACATQAVDRQDDGLNVYFRDADLGALSDQALPVYGESDPGESEKLARAFPGSPPQIPHAAEDMLEITADENECLECHLPANAGADDVPLPGTHFEQPVMGAGDAAMAWVVKGYEKSEALPGSRYHCTMCHAPQAVNVSTPRSTFGAP